MFCPGCGNKLLDGDKFCGSCGRKIEDSSTTAQHVYKNEEFKEHNYNDVHTYEEHNYDNAYNNIKNDIYYENIFIGSNADIIRKEKFNVGAFFFGWLYAAYRKFYLAAFLLVVVSSVANVLTGFGGLIVRILFGFYFNKYYLEYVSKKVKEIRNSNPGDLEGTLRKKGGTDLVLPIILFVLLFIIIFFIVFIILILVFQDGEFNSVIQEIIEDSESTITYGFNIIRFFIK